MLGNQGAVTTCGPKLTTVNRRFPPTSKGGDIGWGLGTIKPNLLPVKRLQVQSSSFDLFLQFYTRIPRRNIWYLGLFTFPTWFNHEYQNNVRYTNVVIPHCAYETSTRYNCTCLLLVQKEQKRLCIKKYENSKNIYTNTLLPSFFIFSFSHKRQSQEHLIHSFWWAQHCFNPDIMNTWPDSTANG